MNNLPYEVEPDDPNAPPIGLIVLQTDETIEQEMRWYFTDHPSPIYVSRIPSGAHVNCGSLSAMQQDLALAADLLPKARPYPVVGYGCTSASSVIGSDQVEHRVRTTCAVTTVTNPLRAGVACARHLGISRLALLSPYIEEVSRPLRHSFAQQGISTDLFASFGEQEEAKVVRISTKSLVEAASRLGKDTSVEGVFISCTNLRTYAAIPEIEALIRKPVLSSNQSLAWHMKRLAVAGSDEAP